MFSSRSSSSFSLRLRWADVLRSLGIIGLVVGLGLVACDSNDGGPPPSDLEGTYLIEEMRFVVSGVDNFNIREDTLMVTENSPRMEFFGGNATVNLIYRLEGSDGSSLLSGQFTTSRNRVTADFSNVRQNDRFEILLPPVVRFQRENNGNRLVANQEVRDVDLKSYSSSRYGGLNQNVNGTLQMRLTRVQPE